MNNYKFSFNNFHFFQNQSNNQNFSVNRFLSISSILKNVDISLINSFKDYSQILNYSNNPLEALEKELLKIPGTRPNLIEIADESLRNEQLDTIRKTENKLPSEKNVNTSLNSNDLLFVSNKMDNNEITKNKNELNSIIELEKSIII